jgi:hypothetical protein
MFDDHLHRELLLGIIVIVLGSWGEKKNDRISSGTMIHINHRMWYPVKAGGRRK